MKFCILCSELASFTRFPVTLIISFTYDHFMLIFMLIIITVITAYFALHLLLLLHNMLRYILYISTEFTLLTALSVLINYDNNMFLRLLSLTTFLTNLITTIFIYFFIFPLMIMSTICTRFEFLLLLS